MSIPLPLWQWTDSLDGFGHGPFLQETQYLDPLASASISHAKELSLTPHAVFAPIPHRTEYLGWESRETAINRWNDFVAVDGKIDDGRNRIPFVLRASSSAIWYLCFPHSAT